MVIERKKAHRIMSGILTVVIFCCFSSLIGKVDSICHAAEKNSPEMDSFSVQSQGSMETNYSSIWEDSSMEMNQDGDQKSGYDYPVQQSEIYDLYEDLSSLDVIGNDISEVNERYDADDAVSFEQIYTALLDGDVQAAIAMSIDGICHGLTSELLDNRVLLSRLMILIIIAAIFNNYSSVLKFSYVGDMGFYITYLMSAAILIRSFTLIYDLAENAVEYVSELMKCMLPAFSMSLVMCSGITTTQMVNTLFVWMLGIMEKLLCYGILPAIKIHFLIVLLNQLNSRDRFSKLAELIKQGTEWILKVFTAAILGLNVMKSMLVPVYENVKYNMLQKGINMIPGGSTFTGISNIMIGAGVVIKNCVGIAAVIMLVVLGCIPVVKILFFYICYRLILAAAQPVSDPRLLMGVQGACDSTAVLMRTVLTSLALCILTIAIIILTTNV